MLTRLGFQQVVQQCAGFHTCGEAAAIEETFEHLEKSRPDLAVLDMSLRNGLGLRTITQAKQRYPRVRFIVVSPHTEAFYAGQVLAAGAQACLSKSAGAEILAEALQRVAGGEAYVSADVAQQLLRRAGGKQHGSPAGVTELLTGRETQVFELMGQGLNTKRIAKRLEISPHTVETYRERIRVKIDAKDGTDLTFRAICRVLLNS
jgi:DNA-binding NarL/FixJ family response regulator